MIAGAYNIEKFETSAFEIQFGGKFGKK